MPKQIGNMTEEECVERLHEISDERAALQEEAREVHARLDVFTDARQAEIKAAEGVPQQAVTLNGIESAEATGRVS